MQDPKETFNNIEHNTEMALLQSEKIAESVDNLEPIMEGVLVKTDEMVQEMKKTNEKPQYETRIMFEGIETATVRGRDGRDGEKGERGDKGDVGPIGLKGDKGDRGEQGERGIDGIDGYNGRDGLDGLNGMPGLPGKAGRDGINGIDGKDGKDGSTIKPEEIKKKLESLKVGLDYDSLSNVPDIAKIARVASSKTVSLVELDDVDYSGLNKTDGKYVLGGGDSFTGVTVDGTTVTGDGLNTPLSANFSQTGKYMISGGAIWSGTGLTYNVSYLTYFFDGNKTADATSVTLDASDPTNSRIDAIVVDEAGVITVITGDATSSPVEPPIPEDQLQVQFILVEAGSTTPTITSESIYLDNPTTNWTFSTYQTATPTGSINFAGTSSPKQGTECIEASTDARLGARFVRATSFDAFQYTMLQVWVRFTGTAVATNKSLNVRFENSAGTLVGSTVNLFSYGLQRGVLNTWQLVVVPITAFGALPATVKGLKVIMAGGTVGVVRQWDIDYMILTNGSVPFANVPTIAFYANGTGFATQSGVDLVAGTGITITPYNDVTNQRAKYTITSTVTSPITVDTVNNNIYSGTISAGSAIAGTTGAVFLGYQAGQNVTTPIRGVMIGYQSGKGITTGSPNIVTVGSLSGLNATAASASVFVGNSAGSGATNSQLSVFIGRTAGLNASSAQNSVFVGDSAGSGATSATNSHFIGTNAGYQAVNAAYSIFIGRNAGYTDTVNNTSSDSSIVIGNYAGTGGFKNSISLGAYAVNTAVNQMVIGSATSLINTVVVNGTGGIQVPVGTTGERVAVQGMIRYNTTTSKFEGYDGAVWQDFY